MVHFTLKIVTRKIKLSIPYTIFSLSAHTQLHWCLMSWYSTGNTCNRL